MANKDFEQSLFFKGYGLPDQEREKCKKCPKLAEAIEKKSTCPAEHTCLTRFHNTSYNKGKNPTNDIFDIIVITSLAEYFKYLESIEVNYIKPVFYRGQSQINYLVNPAVFREGKTERETLLYNEFKRRFPTEFKNCTTKLEELVLMQHYGLKTRLLDIAESPLTALYFACSPSVKFPSTKNPDLFNIARLYYKDKDKKQKIFVIPPCAKPYIKVQLAKIGISEAFVYPEMDTVANELNTNLGQS